MSSANNPGLTGGLALTGRLAAYLEALAPPPPWWVAFSGGQDSLALLAAMSSVTNAVAAIHIDHGLQPTSREWGERCRGMAGALGVEIRVERVDVENAGEGVEAAARQARYAVFEQLLYEGGTVFTAHHADDQAETQLLQLLRGGGLAGIAGMPADRSLGSGRLVRPWLAERRGAIREIAAATGLDWIEDPDNNNLQRDRNFLRHRVMPVMAERWPDAARRLARSSEDAASNLSLLRSLADERLAHAPDGALPLSWLRRASMGQAEWLFRRWLQCQGVRPPGRHRLTQGLTDLLQAAPDAQPVLAWTGGQIRRHRGELVLLPRQLPGPPDPAEGAGGQGMTLTDGSRLSFQRRRGGVAASALARGWGLVPRQGGETLRWHGQSRPVKKLLQDTDKPVWERAHYPLLWSSGRLIAIPGVAVADEWRAAVGYWPVWTPSWSE